MGLCHYCVTDQTGGVRVVVILTRHGGVRLVCAMVLQHSSFLLSLQIKQVRRATREEKKKKAMAMREKELGALGLQVSFGLTFTHALVHIHLYMHLDNVV